MTNSSCDRLISCQDMALPRERFRERLVELIGRELDRQQATPPMPAASPTRQGGAPFDRLMTAGDTWRLDDYIDAILTVCGAALDSRSMPSGIEIT